MTLNMGRKMTGVCMKLSVSLEWFVVWKCRGLKGDGKL